MAAGFLESQLGVINITKWLKIGIGLFAVVNNSFILLVMLRSSWRKKSSTVYFVLIAIFDTFAIFSQLLLLFDESRIAICGSAPYLTIWGILYPVWLLTAMITERTVAVLLPLKAKLLLTTKKNIYVAGFLWVSSFLISLTVTNFSAGANSGCNSKSESWIRWLLPLLYSFIPFIWIVICNIIIVYTIKQSARLQLKAMDLKMVKIVIVQSITFIILTGPLSCFNIFGIKESFNKDVLNIAQNVPTNYIIGITFNLLLMLYHSINAFIYAIVSTEFRSDLFSVLRTTYYYILC